VRIANLLGRLALVADDAARALDVYEASGGRFGPDPQQIYDRWIEFRAWAATVHSTADMATGTTFPAEALRAPTPAPRQVFAMGLNYRDHAAEAGMDLPKEPNIVFTKWPSCLTGPVTEVQLPAGGNIDWEVELVAVIGAYTYRIGADQAWDRVAGLTVGQDISERITQTEGPTPQFGLGKSLPGFGPIGPWVVTPDEFADPDDIGLGCSVNGERMQSGRTGDLVFSVPTLIAKLSQKLPLLPGDIVFTGTPAGVGLGRDPQRFLQPGDELVSYADGIGELRQRFVAAPAD
jgi:2,4-didehydro-3-deoxy-L-rhamnonate hydrolase